MAKKPHNYKHFKELVNELKSQNAGMMAMMESKLDLQTDILRDMYKFFLTDDKKKKIKDKEKRLEEKSGKIKNKLTGKGIMGGLGEFLSTALTGGPGLMRLLPSSIGIGGLFTKLLRGFALAVVGPSIFEALGKAFEADTVGGGFAKFIDTYFAVDKRKSLAKNIAGNVAAGSLLGFAALGIKGAIIGGLLGGGITILSKMLGQETLDTTAMKEEVTKFFTEGKFLKLVTPSASAAVMALVGAKAFMAAGPPGIMAGIMLGGSMGLLAGLVAQTISYKESDKESMSQAFFRALSDPKSGMYVGITTGIGAIIGAAVGGGLPGAILGAIAGNLIGNAIIFLAQWLRGLSDEIDVWFQPALRRAAKAFMKIKQIGMTMAYGDFSAGIKMARGEFGTDVESANKLYKEGKLSEEEYWENIASLSGDADLIDDIKKIKRDLVKERKRIAGIRKKWVSKGLDTDTPQFRNAVSGYYVKDYSVEPNKTALGVLTRRLDEKFKELRNQVNENLKAYSGQTFGTNYNIDNSQKVDVHNSGSTSVPLIFPLQEIEGNK